MRRSPAPFPPLLARFVTTEEVTRPPVLPSLLLADAALRRLGLTPREAQVMRATAAGRTNVQVARQLDVRPATVKKHLEHIYEKLDVGSRGAAVARVLALDAAVAAAARPATPRPSSPRRPATR